MLMKESTGLIVVDIQGDLARLVHNHEDLISNCEKLIKGSQALNVPIILLEQNPDRLGPTVNELGELLNDITPINKLSFNACASTEFINSVATRKVDTWLVCGIEAHICVYQTVKGLLGQGYKVELVSDCISSRTLFNKQVGIDRLQSCGAEITSLEMCLYELVKDCESTEFKTILDLIR